MGESCHIGKSDSGLWLLKLEGIYESIASNFYCLDGIGFRMFSPSKSLLCTLDLNLPFFLKGKDRQHSFHYYEISP